MWGVFIWAVFSLFIVGVFGWSMAILFQQKRSWESFAKKLNLEYTPGNLMGSPAVTGKIGRYRMTFFTDAQKTTDVRGQRMVTVIEAEMGIGMSAPAAFATKEYKDFIADLNLPDTYEPGIAEWNSSYIAKTRDLPRLLLYMTPDRLKTLHSLFSMKNSIALFFFDMHEAVLRIETPDPLRNAAHMEKIMKRLVDVLDRLRPTDVERERWGALQPSEPPSAPIQTP